MLGKWLAWAEFCYNTSYHNALGTTPFKVVYGRDLPSLLSYELGPSKVATLDQALAERDTLLTERHREVFFSPGDYVWLRLQHYRQLSLTASKNHKLSPKYYGPFQVMDRIGTVAYRLQLPPVARIYNVFHESPLLHTPLPALNEGRVLSTPAQVLQAHHIQDDWEILVQWADADPSDTTWEPVAAFRTLYPYFELEDILFIQEGGDVMDSIAS
ncbi:uncharacterized protein [Aristolochia californica]|uniref:uncharacterized protein n=1 Tax=Aristolochia californica TaxID=171875 RepID=UPI0035D5348D